MDARLKGLQHAQHSSFHPVHRKVKNQKTTISSTVYSKHTAEKLITGRRYAFLHAFGKNI
jgi:hypothetical protein